MFIESGKAKYAESKRLIQLAMREKQLVLFIGAGASVASGMPLWKHAIKKIAERIGEDPEKIDSLIIPQYYFNARRKKEYTQLMREIFKHKEPLETTEVHKLIMQFDVETIITTNYDHLLEQAAEENGIFLQVIAKDTDLPYRKAGRELIKMHGDFEHDNFVLKEDDYLHYHRNFKLIETYIKSLIGTKTVLFIGYSLSDPDVKQILTWVKEILDEEFQHAYMIKTNGDFKENEKDYYKHLGVNIIYSSELLEKSVTDETNRLNQTLKYLLLDETENKSVIDQIHEELKPFKQMNYTLQRYINGAMHGNNKPLRTLRVDNNVLTCNRSNFVREDIELLTGLHSIILGQKVEERIEDIYNAIRHSSLTDLYFEEGEKRTQVKFPEEKISDYEDAIQRFDYEKLNEIKEKNARHLSDENPELYFQQAMICSFIRDYETAFFCLDHAANICYRKKLFAWYFIAQLNKVNISRIIVQLESWHIDKKRINQIQQEADTIDLNKTLLSIPDLGHHHNKFLKDLVEFSFSSSIMYEAYKTSRTVGKESKQKFLVHTAPPAYNVLRNLVYDYYYYCSMNYIQVDRYPENTEIYNLFARSLLSSHSIPAIEKDSSTSLFGASTNLCVENLCKLDVYLLLRYVDISIVKELLHEYDIKHINLDEEAQNYVQELSDTIPVYVNGIQRKGTWLFEKFLLLTSYMELSEKIVLSVLEKLNQCTDINVLWDMRNSIASFMNSIYKQKLYQTATIRKQIDIAITSFILLTEDSEYGITNMWSPIVAMMNCLYAAGKPYSNIDVIKRIVEKGDDQFAIDISSDCSEEIRKYLKSHYNGESQEKLRNDPYMYANLVLNDFIELDSHVEEQAFSMIQNTLEDQKSGITSYPKNTLFLLFLNLYLSDKLINKAKFISITQESDEEFIKWMTDLSSYNYEHFETSWLTNLRKEMLQRIAENEEISHKIRIAFAKEYNAGKDIKDSEKIIMKYFMGFAGDGDDNVEELDVEKQSDGGKEP